MDRFDFPATVEPPRLASLEKSFAVDRTEEELKSLFIRIFRETLSAKTYDVNVSGAAHLGSFDLVRRSVNADGLTILQGDREEYATRYLYRAWQARDTNGRGMHFLRTYLQLLYPGLCQVAQLWQDKDQPYPKSLHSTLEQDEFGNEFVPDPKKQWLTSRVEIALDLTVTTRSITTLTNIFRAILPARLVPQFRFWIKFECYLRWSVETFLQMRKRSHSRIPYCGLIVTARPDGWFRLGRDDAPDLAHKLGSCRVRTGTTIYKCAEAAFDSVPRIGEPGRFLDGTWKLPRRATGLYATFSLTISHDGGYVASNVENYKTKVRGFFEKDALCKLDKTPRIGEPERYLDGTWGIPASPRMKAQLYWNIGRLGKCKFDTTPKLGAPDLLVDGTWNVPAVARMSASCVIKVSK